MAGPTDRSSADRHNERGFTLIELLVVILIIGILAAIALPAFLNQRHKAQEAAVKTYVVAAQKAMEQIYDNNDGSYLPTQHEGVSGEGALVAIEPELSQVNNATNNFVFNSVTGNTYSFQISPQWSVHAWYRVQRLADGTVTRTCGQPSQGSCPASGSW